MWIVLTSFILGYLFSEWRMRRWWSHHLNERIGTDMILVGNVRNYLSCLSILNDEELRKVVE